MAQAFATVTGVVVGAALGVGVDILLNWRNWKLLTAPNTAANFGSFVDWYTHQWHPAVVLPAAAAGGAGGYFLTRRAT